MRIAHVVSTFPPRVGGMGSVCFEELKRLAELGHEVAVFTMRYKQAEQADELIKLPFKIIRLKPLLIRGDGGWLPQLFFRLNNFYLTHLHYPFYVSAHSVLWAKWFRKQKYVITYHMDAQSQELSKKFVQRIYDFIFAKRILKNAEKVIVVDRDYFLTSRYGRYLLPEKIVEIPNGVDTEIFRPNTPQNVKDKKIILFVANLMPVKRLDLLLQALKLIDDKDVVLLVVGGGYKIEKYKKMVQKLKIEDRVKFVGVCNDKKKLAEYYNLAWCTAIPSASESFSLVALESMACGCPVVASDMPGIKGRIENGVDGWLVSSDKSQEWAEMLLRVLSLSVDERKKMGEAGRRKVLLKYVWEKHTDCLSQVYASIEL